MATPRKSVSARQPEGETGLVQRWWRNPAVIVAIITGIFSISVAVIQLAGSKSKQSEPTKIERQIHEPKLSEPTKIEQHTHGSGSPAVGQTGGNVTIHQQGSGEKP
jgi:hypothetical protein